MSVQNTISFDLKTFGFTHVPEFIQDEAFISHTKTCLEYCKITNNNTAGHSNVQWKVREQLGEIYSKILDTTSFNLYTSFEDLDQGAVNSFKVNQSPSIKNNKQIQSIVVFNKCKFTFIPYSHLMHYSIFKDFVQSEINTYVLSEEEQITLQPMLSNKTEIECEPGDLLLFDSRTFYMHSDCLLIKATLNKKTHDQVLEKKRKQALFECKNTNCYITDSKLFVVCQYPNNLGQLTFTNMSSLQKSLCFVDNIVRK
jgi:hypothetical protein